MCSKGWDALNNSAQRVIFCTHADVLATIYSHSNVGVEGTGNSFSPAFNAQEYGIATIDAMQQRLQQLQRSPASTIMSSQIPSKPTIPEVRTQSEVKNAQSAEFENSYGDDEFEPDSPHPKHKTNESDAESKIYAAFLASDSTQQSAAIQEQEESPMAMPKLQEIQLKKIFLIISAHVSRNALQMVAPLSGFKSNVPVAAHDAAAGLRHSNHILDIPPPPDTSNRPNIKLQSLKFPATVQQCSSWWNEVCGTSEETARSGFLLEGNTVLRDDSATGNMAGSRIELFAVPSTACDSILPPACLEFAAICMSPPVDGAGIRSVEGRLELLLLPSQHSDQNSKLLSDYHHKVAEQVSNHMDRLLEGLTEQQATALRHAEDDIRAREKHLKSLRDDVEKERRTQELLLRDMRYAAISAEEEREKEKTQSHKKKSKNYSACISG